MQRPNLNQTGSLNHRGFGLIKIEMRSIYGQDFISLSAIFHDIIQWKSVTLKSIQQTGFDH